MGGQSVSLDRGKPCSVSERGHTQDRPLRGTLPEFLLRRWIMHLPTCWKAFTDIDGSNRCYPKSVGDGWYDVGDDL